MEHPQCLDHLTVASGQFKDYFNDAIARGRKKVADNYTSRLQTKFCWRLANQASCARSAQKTYGAESFSPIHLGHYRSTWQVS